MVACTLRYVCLAKQRAHGCSLGGSRLPDALARADVLFQTVLQKVQKQVYEVYGAIELMTVVLLRQFEQMRGHYSSAWMLWGNAVKMMQFLSLHIYDEVYSQPHTIKLNNLLTPEALRRLAWAVFFLDSMGDAGRHGVHTVTEEAYHIQLPCDEEAFARGIEMRTECLKRPEDVSILSPTGQTPTHGPVLGVSAHIIKTAAFRRRICHYKSRIKYMTASADAMLTDLAGMEAELKLLMAELPSDLVYSDDNLYIHPERRTAFILLHALRHNCFIMLAESRLIACSRDPNLHESGYAWMRDRVRHAYPVASIISDALRLGIVCDPFIGALSYTAIEVLLFDPPRLAKHDPTVDPKSYELIRALRKLLEMIRFDWRLFRWHRLEQTTKIPNAAKNPWAAEAILDLDAKPISRAPSRRPSPRPDQVDASAVSSRPEHPVMTLFGGDNVSPVVGLDPAEADLFGNVHSSLHGQNTLSFAEGNWSFEDNFSRFMEQAGYTTVNEGESLPWLPV
ncbi:hypothetical protein DB88DRAFT_371134 [Papiliotrema laurentii]|uniref:Xylanolytic transcriptional activator regulatory domain-containing protein n=1 Tax=Papiliotrema laurentii TaxID=5418 RepID=A0AAD9CYJ5_PAPLA|nr:hypothetical protein DB88DRAFT_371134 [Papiliotrema laurentii]